VDLTGHQSWPLLYICNCVAAVTVAVPPEAQGNVPSPIGPLYKGGRKGEVPNITQGSQESPSGTAANKGWKQRDMEYWKEKNYNSYKL